ncbi:hypothetical protein [Streptomyces sp. NPDC089919]|uniref:hypothetical protein n=1 Tax=Streptomyces sp. NPDC089919 TaxID=3155188 RepID=UPI003443808A
MSVELDRVLSGVRYRFVAATVFLPATVLLPAAGSSSPAVTPLLCPLADRWIALPALSTFLAEVELARLCCCRASFGVDRDFFPLVVLQTSEAGVAWCLYRASVHLLLVAGLATAVFTAASATQLVTAHVHDLVPDASTVMLHDDGLCQGCMTHQVLLWARSLLMAARRVWDIATGTGGPLFTDPLGSTGVLFVTAFAERWKLCPPEPSRPKPCKGRTASRAERQQKTLWPVCTVHYGLAWAMRGPDTMRGCPYPPPHSRRSIARRKNGWLPPDYGLRELQPLR